MFHAPESPNFLKKSILSYYKDNTKKVVNANF